MRFLIAIALLALFIPCTLSGAAPQQNEQATPLTLIQLRQDLSIMESNLKEENRKLEKKIDVLEARIKTIQGDMDGLFDMLWILIGAIAAMTIAIGSYAIMDHTVQSDSSGNSRQDRKPGADEQTASINEVFDRMANQEKKKQPPRRRRY